jgi:hypothetical protein
LPRNERHKHKNIFLTVRRLVLDMRNIQIESYPSGAWDYIRGTLFVPRSMLDELSDQFGLSDEANSSPGGGRPENPFKKEVRRLFLELRPLFPANAPKSKMYKEILKRLEKTKKDTGSEKPLPSESTVKDWCQQWQKQGD